MSYQVVITIKGLSDDDKEYSDEVEEIVTDIANRGYDVSTGIGEEE